MQARSQQDLAGSSWRHSHPAVISLYHLEMKARSTTGLPDVLHDSIAHDEQHDRCLGIRNMPVSSGHACPHPCHTAHPETSRGNMSVQTLTTVQS